MVIVRSSLVLLIALLSAACASTTEQHAQQVGNATDQATVEFTACVKAVRAKPVYAPLLPHSTDVDTGQPTMAQLIDTTKPTQDEARLVAQRFDESNTCRSEFLDALATVRPDLVPIFESSFTRRASIAAALVQQRITWAEASNRSRDMTADLQNHIATANHQWVTAQTGGKADPKLRQAAQSALMHWSTEQQMFSNMNSR